MAAIKWLLIKFLTTENSGIEFKERPFLDIIYLLLCNYCCYILHLPIHDLFTLHCMVQNPAEIKVSKLVATHIRCIYEKAIQFALYHLAIHNMLMI